MAYSYALNVIRQRNVNGRTAFAGVSRSFAVTRGTATEILSSLGLGEDLDFINSDEDVCSVQVSAQKILEAKIDPKQQIVNGQELGFGNINLRSELEGLLEVQQDLRASSRATVFLELN
ncbi:MULTISPECIES: hypothetical protein [Microvirga]|nr:MULTISPECIES: hypothetical protein [unclassified Microvirga]